MNLFGILAYQKILYAFRSLQMEVYDIIIVTANLYYIVSRNERSYIAKSVSFFTRLGYGQFPYIIIREQVGMYRQIPIHFGLNNPDTQEGLILLVDDCDTHETLEDKCDEALKRIITKKPVLFNRRINYEQGCIIPNRKLSGCVHGSSAISV